MANVALSTRAPGGAESVTSSVDVILTSVSAPVQFVIMTTTGLSLILPDATTIPTGTTYTVKAVAASFTIKNSTGATLATVAATSTVYIYLIASATSAGTWTANTYANASAGAGIYGNVTWYINSTQVAGAYNTTVALSSTLSAYSYVDSPYGLLRVVLLDTSSAVAQVSQPATISNVRAIYTSLIAISPTKLMCAYYSTSYDIMVCIFNISGHTITADVPVVLSSSGAGATHISLAMVSTNKIICAYNGPSSQSLYTVVADVAESTITPGMPTLVDSSASIAMVRVASLVGADVLCSYASDLGQRAVVLRITDLTVFVNSITTASVVQYLDTTVLSPTKAVCTYSVSNKLTARVLDISDTTVTIGTAYALGSNGLITSVATLSPTRAICSYYGTSGYGTVVVLDIVDAVVTFGTPTVYYTNYISNNSISVTSETSAIVSFYNNMAVVQSATVSIVDLVATTALVTTGIAADTDLTALEPTKLLAVYGGITYYLSNLRAVVLDIVGDDVIPGNALAINLLNNITFPRVATISSTKAICVYVGDSNYIYAVLLTVSGSTITAGTPVQINSTVSTALSLTILSSTKAVCTYRGTSNYLQAVAIGIADAVITFGTPTTINAAATTSAGVTALSDTRAVCMYAPANGAYAIALGIADLTVTAGVSQLLQNSVVDMFNVNSITLSPTRALCTATASTNVVLAFTCTISDLTVLYEAFASVASASGANAWPKPCKVSSTQTIVVYQLQATNTLMSCKLDTSGTTLINAGSSPVLASDSGYQYAYISAVATVTNKAAMLASNSKYLRSLQLSVSVAV